MTNRPSSRRLFWKLYFALLVSMALSIAGTTLYFALYGIKPPAPEGELLIGFIPAAPLLSSVLAITIVALVLAWYLSRPVAHLRWALRQAASGKLDTRVQPLLKGQRDEIADLALDFDTMAEQLEAAVNSQRQLLHDVSHELRSPLSRLEAAIGLTRQNPERSAEMLTRIETESARLNALIEELMTLHRLDSGNPSLQRERVDLIELLHAIAEDAEFEGLTKGVSVHIDAPGRFVADVHGELIYRAFENVIRNALKFAPPDSTIDIATHADKGTLQVTVADRGCGVPDDMLEAIFMPFVRSGAQSTTQRGTGLGLAITRRAIQMHGGTVKAMSRDGGGLAIGFSLPAS